MCGIVGMMGSIFTPEEKMFKELLIIDQLRGAHSTGIASVQRPTSIWRKGKEVSTEPSIKIAKELGSPNEGLLNSASYRDALRGVSKVLIGHNRYATKGAKVVENAHPFEWFNTDSNNHYVGVHNGTLTKVSNLIDHAKFDVDSENIFYDMAAEDDAIKTLEKLSGDYALVWFSSKNDTLCMARNAARPLYYLYSKDRKTLFWASEPWMMRVVAMRSHARMELEKDAVEVPVGTLLEFKVSFETGAAKPLDEPEQTPFTIAPKYIRPAVGYGTGYGVNWKWDARKQIHVPTDDFKTQSSFALPKRLKNAPPVKRNTDTERYHTERWWNWGCGVSVQEVWCETTSTWEDVKDVDTGEISLTISYTDCHGRPMLKKDFNKAVAKGCDHCSKDIEWGDTAFFHQYMTLCDECGTDHVVVDYYYDNLRDRNTKETSILIKQEEKKQCKS